MQVSLQRSKPRFLLCLSRFKNCNVYHQPYSVLTAQLHLLRFVFSVYWTSLAPFYCAMAGRAALHRNDVCRLHTHQTLVQIISFSALPSNRETPLFCSTTLVAIEHVVWWIHTTCSRPAISILPKKPHTHVSNTIRLLNGVLHCTTLLKLLFNDPSKKEFWMDNFES